MSDSLLLATAYHSGVHDASRSSAHAEPEAQLTTPVSLLFSGLAKRYKLGDLRLIRESRLGSTRPDFAALVSEGSRNRQIGFIELKAPSVPMDPEAWVGRNRDQWQKMSSEAEILLLCNGRSAKLFQDGVQIGESADLPFSSPGDWNPDPLIILLRRFIEAKPSPVTSVGDLSRRLAVRTADLRDRILWLLEQDDDAGHTSKGAFDSWKQHVHPQSSARDFADGVSQVVTYGMVLAALSTTGADANKDGYISVGEARSAIRGISPVMAAAFCPIPGKPSLFRSSETHTWPS